MTRIADNIGSVAASLLLVSLTGCVTAGNEVYASLLVGRQPVPLSVALAQPLEQVPLGRDFRFHISTHNPLLEDSGVRAGYRVIAFLVPAPQSLDIETRSYLSPGKARGAAATTINIMLPVLRLFDASGRQVELKPDGETYYDSAWSRAYVARHWESSPVPAGAYRLLMYADNDEPGRAVVWRKPSRKDAGADSDVPITQAYQVFATYPFGKARVRIQ